MLNEKHDLVHEFPEHRETIRNLKSNNHHFVRISAEYHKIDREILRIETGIENSSDAYLDGRKKIRLHLKDDLFQMIRDS